MGGPDGSPGLSRAPPRAASALHRTRGPILGRTPPPGRAHRGPGIGSGGAGPSARRRAWRGPAGPHPSAGRRVPPGSARPHMVRRPARPPRGLILYVGVNLSRAPGSNRAPRWPLGSGGSPIIGTPRHAMSSGRTVARVTHTCSSRRPRARRPPTHAPTHARMPLTRAHSPAGGPARGRRYRGSRAGRRAAHGAPTASHGDSHVCSNRGAKERPRHPLGGGAPSGPVSRPRAPGSAPR